MTEQKAPDLLHLGMAYVQDEEVGLLCAIQPEDTHDQDFQHTLMKLYTSQGNDGLVEGDIVLIGKGTDWRYVRLFHNRRDDSLNLAPLPQNLQNYDLREDWDGEALPESITPALLIAALKQLEAPADLHLVARMLNYDENGIKERLQPDPTTPGNGMAAE
jgi:hypothetical protein